MDVFYIISTILSSIVALFAWIAKIRWSNEYKEATQQIINSKDAEIESLKSHIERLKIFSPMVVEEYYETNINRMESILTSVQEQLDTANSELSSHKDVIEKYKSQEEMYQVEITQKSELIKTKQERITKLQENYSDLKQLLTEISHEREKEFKFFYRHNPEVIFEKISASSTDLGEVMINDGSSEIVEKVNNTILEWTSPVINIPFYDFGDKKYDEQIDEE